MNLKLKISKIGIKIREWNIKQDKRENSLKFMKENRKGSLVGFFISPFLLPIFLKFDLLASFIFIEWVFAGMAVYFHFKIKRKKEMLMYLDGKIINCPHCKRNFDLRISGNNIVEDR